MIFWKKKSEKSVQFFAVKITLNSEFSKLWQLIIIYIYFSCQRFTHSRLNAQDENHIEARTLWMCQPNILVPYTKLWMIARDETLIETWTLWTGQPNILVPYLNYDWLLEMKVTLKHEHYLWIGQPNILVPYLNYDWMLEMKVTLKHELYK